MTTYITPNTDGERLDQLLARALPDYSRSVLQKLCKQGMVALHNGAPLTDPSYKTRIDQVILVQLPQESAKVTPELEVLYEDSDVIVVNKPAGMLTHAKGAFSDEPTVADFVLQHTTAHTNTNRPGIVHRLDRGTSGVLIAAKTPEAYVWLQTQFSKRKVKKTYIALVKGQPKNPAAHLDLPIERNPRKPQTFRVGANGKAAQTDYEVEQAFPHHSLLRMHPLTGRTHQLRVHAAYLNCPIIGDEFYGKPEPKLGRMFLHAAELEVTLPSRKRTVFKAPLPAELQAYLKQLQ